MPMLDLLLMNRADRERADAIAIETRKLYGVGAEDRLHDQAGVATSRRERRVLLRAAENVQLHYLQYTM